MSAPYTIIEVANCHGGDIAYLFSLIEEFAGLRGRIGMKFQPFYYDAIATPDYSGYELYQRLLFDRDQWEDIIVRASKTKDIWLDLFDSYSLDVLKDNLSNVYGIKLQASVLENRKLLRDLSNIDLIGKILMVNISGFEMPEIDRLLFHFSKLFHCAEVVIQIGFQGYPSDYVDSGLVKIDALRTRHPSYDICFADHVSGNSDEAMVLPVLAVSKGCAFIEKHVMSSTAETRYDHFSALTMERLSGMLHQLGLYVAALGSPFIPENERKYLEDSAQVPYAVDDLPAGTIPSIEDDLGYKRTGQKGLSTREIERLLDNKSILASTVRAGRTLRAQDFKKAVVGTVIACRLKSTRLPRKALGKIGDLTSVEYCIRSALAFSDVNHTVLATSSHPEDEVLQDFLWSNQVRFFRGDPDDVIDRFLSVAESLNLDVIIRVTADCPFVSAEITRFLLDRHFEQGADFTQPVNAAVGTNTEIINVSALRKIKELSPTTELSEYMTYFFSNNRDIFRVQDVELPGHLARDFRLTLDFEEDLLLFNRIQDFLDEKGLAPDLKNVFDFLDDNPDVAEINKSCTLRYKTDQKLINALNEKTRLRTH